MIPAPHSIDKLVQAVPGEDEAGSNLRFSPVWTQILDIRGSDDQLEKGIWSAERRPADWTAVARLTSSILCEQSKDLRLAAWYVEALVRLEGMGGALRSSQLIRYLLEKYGARLHPRGDDDDHHPFVRGITLFDRCLAGTLKVAPMLLSDSGKRSFSLAEFDSAVAEQATTDAAASVSPERIAGAFGSLESSITEIEAALVAAVAVAPCNFNRSMAALEAWRSALLSIQHRASKSVAVVEPVVLAAVFSPESSPSAVAGTLTQTPRSDPTRYPEPDVNFAEILGGSGAEPSGRTRFYQKLAAVEVCLKSARYRSARGLLSELLELIDRLHLQDWEPRWMITAVYKRYLQLLRSAPSESGDAELGNQLFECWVRFDPPSAMEFESSRDSDKLKP